eukprot:GEZU01042426.1.p2 GENE.GEZU01042426.1~~GEZU01042426.1.p2  ORF type:complete len:121 (-),score=57.26 GEZU01042426.1:113-475(-)
MDLIKQLKIKTGAVKRGLKELQSYQKEEIRERERLRKMEEEGVEEGRRQQQITVIDETTQMIPNCRNRVEKSYNELKNFVTENEEAEGIAGTEELAQAKAALAEVQQALSLGSSSSNNNA